MKKKVLTVFLVLALAITSVISLTACAGKYKMKDFIANFEDFPKTYEVGDSIDLSKIELYATFSDDSRETIPLEKVTISVDGVSVSVSNINTVTETAGEKQIEIKYSNIVRSVTIKVNEKHVKTLNGVRFDASAVTKSYIYGDNVSFSGLKVWAKYDDNTETEISLNDTDLSFYAGEENITSNLSSITGSLGQKAIKVRYKTIMSSESFIISVQDELVKINVNIPTDLKTNYKAGETVSLSGITAQAEFNSVAKDKNVTIKFFDGDEEANLETLSSTKGSKTITIKATYDEVVKTQDITINVENVVKEISVNTNDANLNFVTDDEISIQDFSDVTISVVYVDPADNKSISLSDDGVQSLNSLNEPLDYTKLSVTAGEKTITVKYENKTSSFTITVVEKDSALKSITVKNNPTVSSYTAGSNNVSLDGLVVTLSYKDELEKEDEDVEFSNFSEVGIELFLNDKEVESLNDLAKIKAYGVNQISVSVKYLGKTTQFNLTITNKVVSLILDTSNTKLEYKLDENVVFTSISATAVLNYGELELEYSDLSFFDGETDITSSLTSLTNSVSDAKVVTVKYEDGSSTFTIKVLDYITSIELGSKNTFTCDVNTAAGSLCTSFDGLEVYSVYKSGKKVLVSDLTFTNNSITVPGTKTVTVRYGEFETTLTLEVKDVLNSIEVVESSIPTKIIKNGEVNLTVLKVNGTFAYNGAIEINLLQEDGVSFLYNVVSFSLKDSEGVYQKLSQLDLNNIAKEAGDRYIKLTYVYNSKEVSCEFVINVLVSSNGIDGYEKPTSLTNYQNTLNYGKTYTDVDSTEFESALFVNESEDYLVGNENPYKFLPKLTQINILDATKSVLNSFATSTTIKWINSTEEVTLSVKAGSEANTKVYYYVINGIEKEFVTEYYKDNKYQFSENALNERFTLSVLPDSNEFIYDSSDVNPVVWTVKVVKGFNIHNAKELCVLEQNNNRHDWDAIKAELSLTGIKPSAIILHDDMKITKDTIPSTMTFTLADEYSVKYSYNGEVFAPEEAIDKIGIELQRTYIYNTLNNTSEYGIFEYIMDDKESFAIHGNFYSIDLTTLPLVCAFEPQGVTGAYYGTYMSKLSFIEVTGSQTDQTESAEEDETFTFENFLIKGNSSTKQVLVDSSTNTSTGIDNPVFGGGIIFVKTNSCHAVISNINMHSCFIPFYSRDYTVVNYDGVKAYDSFLNGLFVNGESTNTLNNTHMKRVGGPMILLVQRTVGDESTPLIPRVTANDNCVFESYVTGGEQWFANNPTVDVKSLQAMDPLLNMVGKTFFKQIGDKKYHNLLCVAVQESNGDANTQGYLSYNGYEINRIAGEARFEEAKAIMSATGGQAPIALFKDVSGFMNPGGNGLDAGIYNSSMSPISAADVQNTEQFIMYFGGVSIYTQLWDYE